MSKEDSFAGLTQDLESFGANNQSFCSKTQKILEPSKSDFERGVYKRQSHWCGLLLCHYCNYLERVKMQYPLSFCSADAAWMPLQRRWQLRRDSGAAESAKTTRKWLPLRKGPESGQPGHQTSQGSGAILAYRIKMHVRLMKTYL